MNATRLVAAGMLLSACFVLGSVSLPAQAPTPVVIQPPEIKPAITRTAHPGSVTHLALAPDGKSFFSGGVSKLINKMEDATVHHWDLAGNELAALPITERLYAMVLTPDGKTLAVIFDKPSASNKLQHMVELRDASTGKLTKTPYRITDGVHHVLSPDGSTVAFARGQFVHAWELATGKERFVTSIPTQNDGYFGCECLAFSPDSKRLAVGGNLGAKLGQDGGEVHFLDAATGKPLSKFKNQSSVVGSLAYSPDGQILASGGGYGSTNDSKIRFWDTASNKLLGVLRGHTLGSFSLTFSSDGRLLASASAGEKNVIKIWDVPNGVLLANLVGHTSEPRALCFLPGDKQLVSGGNDRSVCIWDVPAPLKPVPLNP